MPLLVAIASNWGRAVVLVQDAAVMNLRVRDVIGPDTPLVGVYSQFGWNHPGPAVFWLLAPFSWLLGNNGWSLVVGTAAVQLGAVTAIGVISWKEGRERWLVLWAAVLVLSYGATGPWMLTQVWNPHIAFPIFVLFLVVSWRALVRPGTYLVWLITCGSVLVQLHIGYGPLVVVLVSVVAVRLLLAIRSGTRLGHLRRTLIGGTGVLVAMWALPVVDALANRGGNLRLLASYFLLGRGGEERIPLRQGLGVAADMFRIPPPWAAGAPDIDPFTGFAQASSAWWLLVPLALIAIGAACFRRAGRPVRMLLVATWAGNAAGTVSLLLIRGKVAPYLFYWRIPLAVLLVAATTAAVVQAVVRPSPRVASGCIALVALALVVPSVQLTTDVFNERHRVGPFEKATADLTGALQSERRPVLVRWVGSPLGGLQAGLLNELEQRGVPVRVDRGSGFQFGPGREASEDQAEAVLYASEQGFVTAYLASLPGARTVAITTPLTRQEEAELQALQLAATRQLEAAGEQAVIDKLDSPLVVFDLDRLGILDPAQRQRLGALNEVAQARRACRCAVISFASGRVPSELSDRWLRSQQPRRT